MTLEHEQIAEEIVEDLRVRYGYQVEAWSRIDRGWMNEKWHMATSDGPIFVKYYHPQRYRLHLPEKRSLLERSLVLQQWLHESGIPCPGVRRGGHSFIQESSHGKHYAVLDWVEGSSPRPGCISTAHMYALGQTTGRMHALLKKQPYDKVSWSPHQVACVEGLRRNLEQARKDEAYELTEQLEAAIEHILCLNFEGFAGCPAGWLHWDLWADNLLLDESGVTGIVDFDRMAAAYPELDIARVIISGAWDQGALRMDAVQAFVAGYEEIDRETKVQLLRAVRLMYLVESLWWLRSDIQRESSVPMRFMVEMKWLTCHWAELEELLKS